MKGYGAVRTYILPLDSDVKLKAGLIKIDIDRPRVAVARKCNCVAWIERIRSSLTMCAHTVLC